MAAEVGTLVTLYGLEVTDDAGYARYREGMAPLLARHGGSFGCDFVVARALVAPHPRINRVFTIVFPDDGSRERFFANEEYRAVRRQWFEPAVATVEVLAEM